MNINVVCLVKKQLKIHRVNSVRAIRKRGDIIMISRIVLSLVFGIVYVFIHSNWLISLHRMDEMGILTTLPLVILVPVLTGILMEIIPARFKLSPEWGTFSLVLIVMGILLFVFNPVIAIRYFEINPSLIIKLNTWGIPTYGLLTGIFAGKALVGERNKYINN